MMHVAVVILNYNGAMLLRQFLPSVIKYSTEATVVVADNGSTDDSIAILKSEFPTVSRIALGANYGFCKGYNEALAQVSAAICVLLNSDVEVTQNWLEPIIKILDDQPDVVAVQPKILSYAKRSVFEYAGAGGGLIDKLGYPFCRGRIFQHLEKDVGQYDDEREVFWASGACMAIRLETYQHHGGLDEDFFAHMEEIDLCWKISRTGKKIVYTGKSTVYHLGAGTLSYQSPRKTYLNFRNNLVMLFKHLDAGELIWKLPLRFLLDWVAAGMYLLKGEPGNFVAVLNAHVHFVAHGSRSLAKRRALRSRYPAYGRQHIFNGIIVTRYFFPKRLMALRQATNNPK